MHNNRRLIKLIEVIFVADMPTRRPTMPFVKCSPESLALKIAAHILRVFLCSHHAAIW